MSQLGISFGDSRPPRVFTVSELVRGANKALEQRFASVWVEGEVSNLKVAGSGHAFFSLVDDGAVLPVAMWRSSVQRLRFQMGNGQALRVGGRLGIYDKQGRFQLYADRAEPAGLGVLMLALERVKERLTADGLLDPARKRPLPAAPRRVGVVTSASGAAIHDILEVARRRCPSRILLSPALVQGDDAPRSLVRALRRLAVVDEVDVIILGRGGGSTEDLWAFNDEQLARAVAECPVPVVSAVGHEVDVTACDWVSDLRAATPSHAAQLVIPDFEQWETGVTRLRQRLRRAVQRRVMDESTRVGAATRRLARAGGRLVAGPRARLRGLEKRLTHMHPRATVARDRRRLDALQGNLMAFGRGQTRAARVRLARAVGALDALSPLAVLERGYSVVTVAGGRVITDVAGLRPGDRLEVRFRRGSAGVRVDQVEDPDDT